MKSPGPIASKIARKQHTHQAEGKKKGEEKKEAGMRNGTICVRGRRRKQESFLFLSVGVMEGRQTRTKAAIRRAAVVRRKKANSALIGRKD